MNVNDTSTWRTAAFRDQIVAKIEEEIMRWGLPTSKPSRQLENENYAKASSKEEYLKIIAKLILRLRQKPKEQSISVVSGTPFEFELDKAEATASSVKIALKDKIPRLKRKYVGKSIRKSKNFANSEQQLICAVCCSSFSSKVSLRKHIKSTRHMIKDPLPSSIMDTIPRQWLFTIIDYFKTIDGYEMEICLPLINSVESTQEWMSEFMKYSQCVYAWEREHVNENKTQHEVVYCCQQGEKRVKSTCKSKISFTLQEGKFSYGTAMIYFVHNHSIPPHNNDFHQYNPSPEVRGLLMKYFENSTNAVEAYRNMQLHIETLLETENKYLEYSADRCKMPSLSWARYLYNTEYNQKVGSATFDREAIELLRKFVNNKNNEQSESVLQFQELPSENFVIFIATACMRRALKSQSASELTYTDNIGSTSQYGLRVYLLLTNIKDEAVPLSVVITSSETNKAIKTGFGLLSTSLDDKSFNGKGRLGPAIIMTDDSIAETVSMKGLFPYSKIVLSTFHFLKACHKWLSKLEHKIIKHDREIIYSFIRRMVYAENETALQMLFDELVEIYKNHELVSSYICKLYEKKQTWAICYRRNFLIMEESGHTEWKHTLSTLKEQILNRIKLREPKCLISYFLNEFSEFYQRRLIDCALNRYINEKLQYENQFNDYLFIQNDHCESLFTLHNRTINEKYFINTDINVCTCHIGCAGISCDHQRILRAYCENQFRDDDQVNDTKTKLELYYIVSGCRDVPEEFFGLCKSSGNLQFDEGIKPLFEDLHTETITDDSNRHFVSVQQMNQLNEKFTEEIETEQSINDQSTSQVYPIIINHNNDESVVKIEDSASTNENITVESAPRVVYSILFENENVSNKEVIEIVPMDGIANNQTIEEIISQTDIKEEYFDGLSREEVMKQELFNFNRYFAGFREIIKKNPNLYKNSLLRLNNQLAKIKNDPEALFRVMNNYKIKM